MQRLVKLKRIAFLMAALLLIMLFTPVAAGQREVQFSTDTDEIEVTENLAGAPYRLRSHSVDMDSEGNAVVVWVHAEGTLDHIYVQRYDSVGDPINATPIAIESLYSSYIIGNIDVAMNNFGDFVVVWNQFGSDSDNYSVHAAVYDGESNVVYPPFQVNTTESGFQAFPVTAIDDAGNFLIAWEQFDAIGDGQIDVYGQFYDHLGHKNGNEFMINNVAGDAQHQVDVSMAGDGRAIAVWHSEGIDEQKEGIYGQLFSSNGSPNGDVFQINRGLGDSTYIQQPAVSMNNNGDFIAVWNNGGVIYGQRFDANGSPLDSEELIVTSSMGGEWADVAIDKSGSFSVVWHSIPGERDVYAKHYDSTGASKGGEFRVNVRTDEHEEFPSVAVSDNGLILVTWVRSILLPYSAPAPEGIYARFLSVSPTNNPPIATDDIYTTAEDQPLNIAAPGVLGNDSDDDPLKTVLFSSTTNGSLTLNVDGSFSYSPLQDYYGLDSFTYAADDGLTESNFAIVTIEVAPVNDPPSFTIGSNQEVSPDSGLQTVPNWATDISTGPANESDQNPTFLVSNDNNALFAVQPAVAPDGTLSFEPKPGAYGTAQVAVQLQDDGGTANGGQDTSSPQSAAITILQDSDGDGVADKDDNAPLDYNPDQGDVDGDSIGDVADPCPNDAGNICDPNGSAATYVDPSQEVTLSTPDGSVSITFPPDALTGGTSVSITDTSTGTGFELTTDRGKVLGIFSVDLQPSPQTFNVPVKITFAWDDVDHNGSVDDTNIREENLVITKDGVVLTDKCRQEPADGTLSDCDTVANTFTFEVDSWSEFSLAAASVPQVTSIDVPSAPVNINNQPIIVTSAFTDGDDDDAHSAQWDWGDGSAPSVGTIDQETNTITGSHTYTEAGVYKVTLTVTDQFPNSGSLTSDYVVIYHPDGGFVTGGGWIDSPAGAYVPDPDMSGKATLGFVSKYKKGATVPAGNTEFQFHAADLNFHSDSYEYLVITGDGSGYAKFKGIGSINGEGAYNFMIWAGDNDPDTFRIRIWTEDESGAETDIYDNGSDQPIGGGSIKVQTK